MIVYKKFTVCLDEFMKRIRESKIALNIVSVMEQQMHLLPVLSQENKMESGVLRCVRIPTGTPPIIRMQRGGKNGKVEKP